MTSAFLVLLPLVPFASMRYSTQEAVPLFTAPPPDEDPPPAHVPSTSGAPVCPDRGGPTSPLSPRRLRERSRGWEWKPLETPGWKILMADHVVVRGNARIDDLRGVGAALEAFRSMLAGELGGDVDGVMFSARVFESAADFRRYAVRCGAAGAESFYDLRNQELVCCTQGPPATAALHKTLAHEFTHAYMDRVWKRTGPLWFAEGMAEYFSAWEERDGRLAPGAVDRRALLLLSIDAPRPLSELLRTPRETMYGPGYAHAYAEAWSFVHYLFSRGDGVADLLLRGEPLKDLEELDRGWRAHLKALD